MVTKRISILTIWKINGHQKKKIKMKVKLIAIFLIVVIGLIMYLSFYQTKISNSISRANSDSSVFDSSQLNDYIFDHSKIPNDDTTK